MLSYSKIPQPQTYVTCKFCNSDSILGILKNNIHKLFFIGYICPSCHRLSIESNSFTTLSIAEEAYKTKSYLDNEGD